jgi:hypothetical protein
VSLTIPKNTTFSCPEFSCRKKLTSDRRLLNNIKLHYPEHLEVACHNNLTICSMPWRIEPTKQHEFNSNKDSVEDLDKLRYLEQVENIAYSESQPPPPPLPQTDTYPGAGAILIDYIADTESSTLTVTMRQTGKQSLRLLATVPDCNFGSGFGSKQNCFANCDYGLSLIRNRQLGYVSKVHSQPVWIGRVVSWSPSGSINTLK